MLKKHKNELLTTIRECELDISLFEGKDDTSLGGFSIHIKGSDLEFKVYQTHDSHHQFSVYFTKYSSGYPVSYGGVGNPSIYRKCAYTSKNGLTST